MTATLTAEPTVAERMTRCPVSVPLDATVRDIAASLAGNRIGAVPVLDGRRGLAGVVSEMDLIRASLRGDLAGLTARDVMSGPPVTVTPDAPVSTASRLLGTAGTRRVFVVDGGRLVGVVSRRDLLRGYLRDDDDIRVEVEGAVRAALPAGSVLRVAVDGGVVLLLGRVEWRSALAGIEQLVSAVPGVVKVCLRIRYTWDDGAGGRRR